MGSVSVRCATSAKMDILRFGPLCFQDLMTDAQPSVVR